MTQKKVAVIVAHPDDETLWAGGTIMNHPEWACYIISLCRGSDKDRAPKFFSVVKYLGAKGNIGDLDDGPGQLPLDETVVSSEILKLLPEKHYDLIITHNPAGEYTRHLRHEETSRSVIHLWNDHLINTSELWTFAYHDGGGTHPPRPVQSADICYRLTENIWHKKLSIITNKYGFQENSFEVKATTHDEAFWLFDDPSKAVTWLKNKG